MGKLLTAVISLFIFTLCHAQPDSLSGKRLLLLYSYHPGFPTSEKVLSGIKSAFEDGNRPVIEIEYMDSKRLNDQQVRDHYYDFLDYKLSFRPTYDLIITSDDNALNFAVTHQNKLFPETPLVFLGVNNIEKAKSLESNPLISGVVEAPSFSETLKLSQKLMPERTNIHILADNRIPSLSDLSAAKNALKTSQNLNSHTIMLSELSWRQLGEKLNELSNQDILLLISAFKDKHNKTLSFEDSLKFITSHTQIPILHTWEHGIESGLMGGVVVSHQEQGYQAGRIARDVLSGKPIADIPILLQSPNRVMLNYQKIKEFKITEQSAPKNTVWINYKTSLLYQHLNSLIILLLVFFTLAGISIFLARKNFKIQAISNQLEEQTSFLRLLMSTIPDLVWIKNPKGVYLLCNQRFELFFGAEEKDIINKTDYDFVDKELADFFRKHDINAMEAKHPLINEEWVTFASTGEKALLETIKTPIYDHVTGGLLGVLGVGRDITKRRESENALRLSASVVENTAEGVVITDKQTNIIQVNKAFSEITGFSADEIKGKPTSTLKSGIQDESFYREMWFELTHLGRWSGELINKRKDESLYPVWQTISAVFDDNHELCHYVSVFSDISQIKKSQQEVFHLAYHDTLTNLPNRSLLIERMDQAVKHADRSHKAFALMFLDLDNFKNINDSRGHLAGDDLLTNTAKILESTIREKDTVARVGGDEFVLLFDDVTSADKAARLARKILKTLQNPIDIDGGQVEISASIGICLYPADGETATELLKNADTAMYRAKQQGRNNFQFYTEQLTKEVIKRVELETELRHAIRRNEFTLHYQPQIDLVSGQLIGAEALIRWTNQKLGSVPPDQFIPVAEETGIIHKIGSWVLHEAAQQIHHWQQKELKFGPVAVNIAGPQITHEQLTNEVLGLLTKFNLTADQIALEVTETFVMQHESSIHQLKTLDAMGIELAIDDFGTGYSSLSYLKKLPVRKLKIDQSFVRDIPNDPDDMAIARTIMALAETLNLKVIAEGVETEQQAQFLKSIGCNEAQGYFYSKPLPAQEFESFCRSFEQAKQ